MLIVDRGSMFCNRSGEECFFFDIDVKGGEKEFGRRDPNGMWVLVLPSMTKGEIVGKYLTDSEWKIFNRHRMLSLMASTVVVMA
jgi:hypothetical protein